MRRKINNCFNWLSKNKRLLNNLLIVIILIRFILLNYVNWNWGLLTTGKSGVQFGQDSSRYIDGAAHLLSNVPFEGTEIFYLGYVFLIAFVKILGAGLEMALLIQLAFALLASYAIFDLARFITSNKTVGIIAAGLFLSNPFITTWHLYIHTDSMYFSFLIFSTWSIYKTIEKHHLKYYIFSFAIVCITALVRPSGWILLPLYFIFILSFSNLKTLIKYILSLIIICLFFISAAYLPLFNKAIQEAPAAEMLLNGGVIWGRPDQNINMPKDPNLEKKNWIYAYNYIVKHPLACLKLATYRVATELLPVHRPWISTKFKIRFLIWVLPAYLLAVFGVFAYKKNAAVIIALTIIVTNIFVISLTHADHEFRFLLYILPLIYLLAVCGLYNVFNKCKSWAHINK